MLPTDEFEAFISEAFAELHTHDESVYRRETRVPVSSWEADWFMRGVRDLGLFEVAVHRCNSGFLAIGIHGDVFRSRSGAARDTHLFAVSDPKGGGGRTLFREVVTQAAAIAQLVGLYGHPVATVLAESDVFEVDGMAFDRSATAPDSRAILGLEAKVDPAEHDLMVSGMQACRGLGDAGAHAEAVARLGKSMSLRVAVNHHRKCVWVAHHLPGTFWAVSPKRSDVFAVAPAARSFELKSVAVDALARASVEERSSLGAV